MNPNTTIVYKGHIFEYWWLHSVELKWKIIKPDGTSLLGDPIDSTIDIDPCAVAYNAGGILDSTICAGAASILGVIALGAEAIPGIGTIAGAVFGGIAAALDLISWVIPDIPPAPPEEIDGIDGENYWAKWTTGTRVNGNILGNPALHDFSMVVGWEPDLSFAPGEGNGSYQIQMIWEIKINHLKCDANQIPKVFKTIVNSGLYYINFNYINDD